MSCDQDIHDLDQDNTCETCGLVVMCFDPSITDASKQVNSKYLNYSSELETLGIPKHIQEIVDDLASKIPKSDHRSINRKILLYSLIYRTNIELRQQGKELVDLDSIKKKLSLKSSHVTKAIKMYQSGNDGLNREENIAFSVLVIDPLQNIDVIRKKIRLIYELSDEEISYIKEIVVKSIEAHPDLSNEKPNDILCIVIKKFLKKKSGVNINGYNKLCMMCSSNTVKTITSKLVF